VSPIPSASRIDSPDDALGAHARFGQAEVQRIVASRGEETIHLHQIRNARDFRRDDDLIVAQADFFGQFGRAQGAGEHGFDVHVLRVEALGAMRVLVHHLRQQILIERTPIHADADRLVVVDRDLDDRSKILISALAADIAGIDPVFGQCSRAFGILRQQQMAVVMEVADDGDDHAGVDDPPRDVGNRRRGAFVVDGHANELRAGTRERHDLRRGACGVGRVGVRH
jgi:hypothetical protein